MCDKSKCNCKKFNQADPKDVEELEKKYEEFSKKQSDSLLKKYLTPEVFQKIKNRKTKYGSTLLDVIQSGLANLDSGIGAYASDPDSYHVFGPLFEPIIEDYHGGFKPSDKHPASNWGNPKSLPKFDVENEYVISTRVRCARSLKGFPFNPTMTKDHYCQIQTELSTALESLECDLKGKYYRLGDMSEETKTQLINDHFLFKEGDRFLQAARSNEFWPDGRGIFYNETKTLLAWVNEEDHLRLISMQQGSDLQAVYRRLIDALQQLERVVKFDRHPRLGYLTFCPTNLGTTIRASVHIKLPKIGADEKVIKDIAGKYNLQVRGTSGEHTQSEGGIWDISNKRRLGLTEFEALNEMANGIAELIKKEKEA